MTTADAEGRQALFNPRSIAIIGASSSPEKIGGLPVAYLKASGFAGPIWPINPSTDQIQGLQAWRSVADLPEAPDLAICAVPGAAAEAAVQACAAKGVRALIMFTAGFAEVSPEGAATQARMAATARAAGMRLAGPNCMGMANLTTGALCSFHPAFAQPMARDGRIGLVSQSGAFGGLSTLMAHLRGMALSHVITTGNEADVDVADGLLYLTGQAQVKVILLYIEGVRDGPRFLEGLRRAHAAGQAVVAIKLGRTAVGSAAAASHTAALAGSDAVADAVLRQFGAYRAHAIEEFFDIACAAAVAGLPRNGRTGIVTVSGGVGVLMADDAGARGLELPPLSDATQAQVRALVPFAGTRNPLDITGQVLNDKSLLRKAFDLLAADEADLSAILTFQGASLLNEANLPETLPPWLAVRQQHPERWLGRAASWRQPRARPCSAPAWPPSSSPRTAHAPWVRCTRSAPRWRARWCSHRCRRGHPSRPVRPTSSHPWPRCVPPASPPSTPAPRGRPTRRFRRPMRWATRWWSSCCQPTCCTRATSAACSSTCLTRRQFAPHLPPWWQPPPRRHRRPGWMACWWRPCNAAASSASWACRAMRCLARW